jgi:tetratricopeptide (TPR) repeat protein
MMLRGLFTLIAALVLSGASAHAQSLAKGKVVDINNKPVEGAVILFKQVDAATKRDTKSDKKGEYIFVGLPSGDYVVTATKDNMTDEHKTKISGSEPSMLVFILQPPRAAPSNPAAANPTAAAAGLTANAGGAGDDANKLAADAIAAYNANNFKEAISKFNDLVKKLPNCMDCYMYLSVAQFGVNDADGAESSLKKAIEIKPTAEAYTMLANLYNQTKRLDLGAEMVKKAGELTAARETEQAAKNQAKETAVAENNKVVTTQNTSASAYNDGVKLWNDKKYPDAKVKFEEATKADPTNADAHYMLGMASINLGQLPAARAAFEQYLKVAPEGDKATQVKGFLKDLPK